MYYLKDDKRKIILFWNPRCACMSLKHWFHELTGTDMPPDTNEQKATYEMMRQDGHKKIIVVRDPIKRFVSICNHLIIYDYISEELKGIERVDALLDFIEKNGTNSNHHFELQCLSHDNPDAHLNEDVAGRFAHIIKIEDGNIISELNKIVGTKTEDYQINIGTHFNRLFDEMGIMRITHLTKEQEERVKKIYSQDYKHFYND